MLEHRHIVPGYIKQRSGPVALSCFLSMLSDCILRQCMLLQDQEGDTKGHLTGQAQAHSTPDQVHHQPNRLKPWNSIPRSSGMPSCPPLSLPCRKMPIIISALMIRCRYAVQDAASSCAGQRCSRLTFGCLKNGTVLRRAVYIRLYLAYKILCK